MLAENVGKLRMKKGLSQEKIARFADVSDNILIKIGQGIAKEPAIATATKIVSTRRFLSINW
ncbi:MAG: helix-turn-helix domain-containing protein [Candidatus Omnitrophica bacterium]|nr:helix-turn-helix domain-containing protein [Candidatus Omnitrophota bacterium]MBU1128850.1 helix-turn-helix domain-containing protein [Candidatus Omnitrophota bacterium]MBU1783920.1 helix-turn-helix domain-containing protein [Candidatus Omnitrophota bacterium]MBU1852150.1 helix-turn-helix domain-containing protein [Candidatus Omnitrophota bacterium]